MIEQRSPFLFSVFGSALVIVLVLIVNYQVFSWTEPTAPPPGGVVPNPSAQNAIILPSNFNPEGNYHTAKNCSSAGGDFVELDGKYYCLFHTSECPDGWQRYAFYGLWVNASCPCEDFVFSCSEDTVGKCSSGWYKNWEKDEAILLNVADWQEGVHSPNWYWTDLESLPNHICSGEEVSGVQGLYRNDNACAVLRCSDLTYFLEKDTFGNPFGGCKYDLIKESGPGYTPCHFNVHYCGPTTRVACY